jgi:pimeloyl-ACP methyl ester carboxylesterase
MTREAETVLKRSISLTLNQELYQAAYWEAGSGTPLLFLHGFMGKSDYWRSLVSLLQPHYRCICVDMLGFGASSKPMIRYDIATLAAFVQQFAIALELPPCVVVGHSLGGWVAAAYALAEPDCVKALVLAAPAGIRDDSFAGRYDHLRPLFWRSPLIDWALWIAKPFAVLLKQSEALAQISWFRRELNAQPAPRSFLLDRLRPEDAIDTVEQDIQRLRLPTLVITGDRDETIPLWHCQTYASEIPAACLVVIPTADHDLPQAYATEMAAAIEAFLHRV